MVINWNMGNASLLLVKRVKQQLRLSIISFINCQCFCQLELVVNEPHTSKEYLVRKLCLHCTASNCPSDKTEYGFIFCEEQPEVPSLDGVANFKLQGAIWHPNWQGAILKPCSNTEQFQNRILQGTVWKLVPPFKTILPPEQYQTALCEEERQFQIPLLDWGSEAACFAITILALIRLDI